MRKKTTMNHLHFDFECASRIDLTKVGSWRYAMDTSTRVLTVAWAWNDDPVKATILPKVEDIKAILAHHKAPMILHAWNAAFERDILRHCYNLRTAPQWSCTMQRAAYHGLPMRLEWAAKAIRSPLLKNMAGRRLMLQMSKPRKDGTFWHEDPTEGKTKLADLAAYCMDDVEAERRISNLIPELPPHEQRISILDERVNSRGIGIDLPLVDRLLSLSNEETKLLNAECAKLTMGEITSPGTQSARLLEWFAGHGFDLGGVGKEPITELLDLDPDDVPPLVREVAVIRQKIAKSSTKKLIPMRDAVSRDGRIRGALQYYAARTGRWGGRIVQPQNLPSRGISKDANSIIADVLTDQTMDADFIRTFWGDPMWAVSSCLRGCIVPTPGNTFYVYDFSQIEARCLAWESGQDDVLELFENGEDVYLAAMRDFRLRDRDMGKAVVLGLGFGMSSNRFIDHCAKDGIEIEPLEAARIVGEWRIANQKTVRYWYDLERAAQSLIHAGGGRTHFHNLTLRMSNKGLGLFSIEMPNAERSLHYHSPRMAQDPVGRVGIVYDGVDPISKQWLPIRIWGSKFVENITQGVARDVMAEAAMRVESRFPNVDLVLSVHDELVFEVDDSDPDHKKLFQEVLKTLTERPHWAPGLPVDAKGQIMSRYGK